MSGKRKEISNDSDISSKKGKYGSDDELVNGISFSELKRIRNSIVENDISTLESEIDKITDINHAYEFYNDDLFAVNWSSEVQRMSSRTCMTLLHFAARFGRSSCVQLLIDKGADVNKYSYYTTVYTDSDSETDVDFEKNVKFNFKRTPLHEMCIGYVDEKSDFPACTEKLLHHGADMFKHLNNRPDTQTAYEFALDIKKEKKKRSSPSFFMDFDFDVVEINPRTEAAEQVKTYFIAHKELLEKSSEIKLSN